MLPAGKKLESFGSPATFDEIRWVEWGDVEEVFDAVAKLGADPQREARARSLEAPVLTVQVFASGTEVEPTPCAASRRLQAATGLPAFVRSL